MYEPEKYTLTFIQGFNQKNNRIYRKYDSLINYVLDVSGVRAKTFTPVNFPINDFLESDYPAGPMNLLPDYLLVASVDDDTIIARYFVTKITHVSGNQYSYHLVRDVLADYDSWLADPAIIHRASSIPDIYSFAKYKKDMNLSQVKTSETLLKDRADGRGWIVGYMSKDLITANSKVTVTKTPTDYSAVVDDISQVTGKTFAHVQGEVYDIGVYLNNGLFKKNFWVAELSGIDPVWTPYEVNGDSVIPGTGKAGVFYSEGWRAFALQFKNTEFSKLESRLEAQLISLRTTALNNHVFNAYSESSLDPMINDGEIIYDRATQKTYRVKLLGGYEHLKGGFSSAELETLNNAFETKAKGAGESWYVNNYDVSVFTRSYTFEEFTEDVVVEADLPANHTQTTDSAFDVFAIPLGGTITLNKVNSSGQTVSTEDITVDDSFVMDIVNGLIHTYKYSATEATGLIDIQWLPYGPDQIVIPVPKEYENYIRKSGSSTKYGYILWLPSCQLEKTLTGDDFTITTPTDALTARIENETSLYRLCSPNQASMFDFSVINNNGVTGFNVDIAYKPYTPYICVAPIFSGLYGANFDDGRGLILSGDFSLDQSTNEWTTYKYNNKNYELIFNRQIASMDVNSSYAIQQANQEKVTNFLNIFGSTAKGAGTGAFLGAKTAGPYGAIAGAVVGGVTSLTDSVIQAYYANQNMEMESQFRSFARNESIRAYQYQIGNIQARADTITKISTFNPNFKIYPILEEYRSTAQERTILTQGIKWNGLSLEQVGHISDFSQDGTFVQATLLRDTTIPPQIFAAINDELEMGVYLYGSTDIDGEDEEETT